MRRYLLTLLAMEAVNLLLTAAVATTGTGETPVYADTYRSQALVAYQLDTHGPYGIPRHRSVNLPGGVR